jgi:hypothetical protein
MHQDSVPDGLDYTPKLKGEKKAVGRSYRLPQKLSAGHGISNAIVW